MTMTTNGPATPFDRQAAALANIQQTWDELTAARDEIAQLKADLNREQDRIVLLVEERDFYRKEYLRVEGKLVEMATVISNIGLLSIAAQDLIQNIKESEVKS